MKKLWLMIPLLCMIGCSPARNVAPPPTYDIPNPPHDPIVIPPTLGNIYYGSGWSITLPASFVKETDDLLELAAFDKNAKTAVMIYAAPYEHSLSDYVVEGTKVAKSTHIKIAFIDTVEWKKQRTVVLEAHYANHKSYHWITKVNGRIFNVACLRELDKGPELCETLVNTFKFTE